MEKPWRLRPYVLDKISGEEDLYVSTHTCVESPLYPSLFNFNDRILAVMQRTTAFFNSVNPGLCFIVYFTQLCQNHNIKKQLFIFHLGQFTHVVNSVLNTDSSRIQV